MTGHKNSLFTRLSKGASYWAGRSFSFFMAITIVIVWAVSGPFFKFSDTWQLVINTGTTIITFLMVFLIQNTQNRDTEALQIKIDELIHVIDRANNVLLDLEEMESDELDKIREKYLDAAAEARKE